jgi:predicted transcriptional regulator
MSEYQGTIIAHLVQHIRVGDIMTRDPVTLSPDTPVADAVEQYFLKYGYGGFPVVADERAIGMLSLSQVRNCSPEDRTHKKVADIMRALDPAIEIAPQGSAMDAVRKMNEADSGRLVVVDNGEVIGLIPRSGVMRFIQIRAQLEAKTETK